MRPGRGRDLLIAAIWACAAGVAVALWFFPVLAHLISITLATWPAGAATGFIIGRYGGRGKRAR